MFLLAFIGSTFFDGKDAARASLNRRSELQAELIEKWKVDRRFAGWALDGWCDAVTSLPDGGGWRIIANWWKSENWCRKTSCLVLVGLAVAVVCFQFPERRPRSVTLMLRPGTPMELVEIQTGDVIRTGGSVLRIDHSYWVGATEVTRAQYQAIMGKAQAEDDDPEKPVVSVTWQQAMQFCEKLTRAEEVQRQGFRSVLLPTADEWEYACRAGAGSEYCTGNTITAEQANVDGPSVRETPSLKKVKQYQGNRFGLYDTHGNAAEWCLDADPNDGTKHLLCGGSYRDGYEFCGAARRKEFCREAMPDHGFRMVAFQTAKSVGE